VSQALAILSTIPVFLGGRWTTWCLIWFLSSTRGLWYDGAVSETQAPGPVAPTVRAQEALCLPAEDGEGAGQAHHQRRDRLGCHFIACSEHHTIPPKSSVPQYAREAATGVRCAASHVKLAHDDTCSGSKSEHVDI